MSVADVEIGSGQPSAGCSMSVSDVKFFITNGVDHTTKSTDGVLKFKASPEVNINCLEAPLEVCVWLLCKFVFLLFQTGSAKKKRTGRRSVSTSPADSAASDTGKKLIRGSYP